MAHTPVLLTEVIGAIHPKDDATYIDATFGGGGYTSAILDTAQCKVIAFDRDHEAIERGKIMAENKYYGRINLIQSPFSKMEEHIKEPVDGIVFDFGVSSFQIDTPERGFSFQKEGPLDMRMDISQDLTAYDVINSYKEEDIANIIYNYGDEPQSRKIAKAIVEARNRAKVKTTAQLTRIIHHVIGSGGRLNSATKTFQALRIFVNDELMEIETALKQSCRLLKNKGRLVTVSFHALEDLIVKNFYKGMRKHESITLEAITKSVVKPEFEEIKRNPRSRSANLRSFQITGRDTQ